MNKKESRYRFQAIKEKYKKNGNMLTESMYRYTDLELGLLAVMGIILVFLLFKDGFDYANFQRLFFVVVFYYSWISRVIFIVEDSTMGSFLAPINEEICKIIVEMGDEEIALRESRRKRDLLVQFIFTCVFFYLYGTTEASGYEWIEQLLHTLWIFLVGGIVCLPFLYYRHRATKRIQDVLLMKEIQRQSMQYMQNIKMQTVKLENIGLENMELQNIEPENRNPEPIEIERIEPQVIQVASQNIMEIPTNLEINDDKKKEHKKSNLIKK